MKEEGRKEKQSKRRPQRLKAERGCAYVRISLQITVLGRKAGYALQCESTCVCERWGRVSWKRAGIHSLNKSLRSTSFVSGAILGAEMQQWNKQT